MLLIGGGGPVARSDTGPYLENGAVVLDGQWWNAISPWTAPGPAPTPPCWTASGSPTPWCAASGVQHGQRGGLFPGAQTV